MIDSRGAGSPATLARYHTVWYGPLVARYAEWVAAGREALLADGAPGVRIDKLAARLGATKGSFYHHFDGAAGFRRALLADLEELHVRRFVDAVEAHGGTARERLEHLMELVLASDAREPGGRLEVALRAWAAQDADAHETQARIDRVRADYLAALWAEIAAESGSDASDDAAFDAEAAAWLVHTALVGSRHLVPALDTAALRRVFALVLQLHPEETDHGPPPDLQQPDTPRPDTR